MNSKKVWYVGKRLDPTAATGVFGCSD